MKSRLAALIAVTAALTLTPLTAAGPATTTQRVAIEMKISPGSTFVLIPLTPGALRRDSGWISIGQGGSKRTVIRHGQEVTIFDGVIWTLHGKRGTLMIRDRNDWVAVGNDASVAIGTWKVVRGTGLYAGILGKGGNGHAGLGTPWYARYEGFLTVP